MLNDNQAGVVKSMIVGSMRSAYTDNGVLTPDGFDNQASMIADDIIKKTQMTLLQSAVFADQAEKGSSVKKSPAKKASKK